MKAYSAAVLAALASGHVVRVQFVLLEFPSGTVGRNTSNWAFTWDGETYLGGYGLGSISPIKDAPGEIQGIRLEMAAGDPATIALALDEADEVQGAPITVRTAIVETVNYTVIDAPIDFAGTCDTMVISEDGGSAVISVSAESRAVDLLRGNPLTYSDADQQSLFPGDLAFQYVVSQVDKPVVWPSREFFFK